MPRTFQNQLLNFMESGRIKQKKQYDFEINGAKFLNFMESGRIKQKKQYDFEINGAKLFATYNEINRFAIDISALY